MASGMDAYIVYDVLKRISTPFDKTKAFEHGIIDADGKLLKKPKSAEERKAYTLLDRFAINIKRVLSKFGLKSKASNFAAAMFLLKEYHENGSIPDNDHYIRQGIQEQLNLMEKREVGKTYRALIERVEEVREADDVNELAVVKPAAKDTLGITRDKMPQIATDDYPEFFEFLKANGAKWTKKMVPAQKLKPIQKEFSDAGVEKALRKRAIKKDSIISKDNYIIDGHHRWLGVLNTDPTKKIGVIQVNMPVRKLLALMKEFPKTTYKAIYEDMPTNSAGGGQVHGIGVGPQGEPGVTRRRKEVQAFLKRWGKK
jgi:hypothetical protein